MVATPANSPKIRNSPALLPVKSLNNPNHDGSRNPPIAPAAPIKPEAVPFIPWNRKETT